MSVTLDGVFANDYIASQVARDDEPLLDDLQWDMLLEMAAVSEGVYTYASLHAAIYIGWTWKLAKAVEYHKGTIRGGESLIFDHCKLMVERWSWAADSTIGSPDMLQLFELEVGANFA